MTNQEIRHFLAASNHQQLLHLKVEINRALARWYLSGYNEECCRLAAVATMELEIIRHGHWEDLIGRTNVER